MITVLFFGQLAEIATRELGQSEITLQLPENTSKITLSTLRLELAKKSATLAKAVNKPSNLCSINQVINQEELMIKANDEVAFMSPLSGG